MEFEVKREYVIRINDAEARELESDLHTIVTQHGSGGFTRSLHQYLKTRKDDFPDGTDPRAETEISGW